MSPKARTTTAQTPETTHRDRRERADEAPRSTAPDARRSPRVVLVLLGILTLVALGARLGGLHARLPHQCDPDYVIVADAAWCDRPAGMAESTFEAYPGTTYPRLLAFLLASLPGHSFARTLPPDAPLEQHLAAAAEPFVRGRLLIGLLSLFAIPGTFFLARRFLGPWSSLLAAAFLATSLAGLFYSQQARPHAAGMAFSLAAVLAILRIPRTSTIGAYLLAGLFCALAVGCLWNGVFVAPALLAAHALAGRRRWIGLWIAIAAIAAAIPLFYGFLFHAPLLTQGRLRLGSESIQWRNLNAAGFGLILKGLFSFDPALVVAAGVGVLALAVRFRRGPRPATDTLRDLCVAAAFPAAFVLYWGIMSRVPPRFSLPLLPYVAILAAFGIESLRPRRAPVLGSIALACAALALPVFACAHLVSTRSKEDTFSLAARWIAAHGDRDRDVVCIPFLSDLPLFEDRTALEKLPSALQSPWQRYQERLPPDPSRPAFRLRTLYSREAAADQRIDPDEVRAMFAADRPTYVMAVLHADSGIGWDSTREVLLEDGHELVASFSGCRPGSEAVIDIGFEEGERGLEKVLAAERPGPGVEIYRLRRR